MRGASRYVEQQLPGSSVLRAGRVHSPVVVHKLHRVLDALAVEDAHVPRLDRRRMRLLEARLRLPMPRSPPAAAAAAAAASSVATAATATAPVLPSDAPITATIATAILAAIPATTTTRTATEATASPAASPASATAAGASSTAAAARSADAAEAAKYAAAVAIHATSTSAGASNTLHRVPARTILPRGHFGAAAMCCGLLFERERPRGCVWVRGLPARRFLRRRFDGTSELQRRQLCDGRAQRPLRDVRRGNVPAGRRLDGVQRMFGWAPMPRGQQHSVAGDVPRGHTRCGQLFERGRLPRL